jgi:CBS domain-containing protein
MSVKTKALSEKLAHIIRSEPAIAQETTTVKDALALMRSRQKPALMICKGKKLLGIFTERDYIMKALGSAKSSDPISKYMTPNPITGRLDETLGEVIEVMDAKHLRTLPIVDENGAVASVVTVLTVIQYLADHFPAAVVNRPPQPHVVSEDADGA